MQRTFGMSPFGPLWLVVFNAVPAAQIQAAQAEGRIPGQLLSSCPVKIATFFLAFGQ